MRSVANVARIAIVAIEMLGKLQLVDEHEGGN
jgi:hypothetical protein